MKKFEKVITIKGRTVVYSREEGVGVIKKGYIKRDF